MQSSYKAIPLYAGNIGGGCQHHQCLLAQDYKQYKTYRYLDKWKVFCDRKESNIFSPSVSEVLDFLLGLYNSGLQYSAINTAHSALSSFITIDNVPVGNHILCGDSYEVSLSIDLPFQGTMSHGTSVKY